MIITSKDAPASVTTNAAKSPSIQDKIAKATAAFNAGNKPQQQQEVVQNPSNVSPEELTAVKQNVQNSTVETPTSELNEPAKAPEDPISSQYATLARKEKALNARRLQQEASFKAREEAFAAKERELATKSQTDTSKFISKDQLQADPIATLSELGLSYDKLVELAMNAPKPEELERMQYQKKIEAELKSLRDEQERTKKSYEEAQSNQYKQALNHIRNEASQLVSSDPEFEAIKATNSVQDVVDLIEQTFKDNGSLLTVEEAARAVEEYLVEEALKIARLNKIQLKMKPAEKPAEQKQAVASPQQQLKTLTNSVSTTRQLSARERAMLAFKGEKI